MPGEIAGVLPTDDDDDDGEKTDDDGENYEPADASSLRRSTSWFRSPLWHVDPMFASAATPTYASMRAP